VAYIFPCEKLKRVQYANTPLSQQPIIEFMTPEEVGKKIVKRKFRWTESIVVNKSVSSIFKEIHKNKKAECEKTHVHPIDSLNIQSYLKSINSPDNAISHLVIAKINNIVGCGLFTTAKIYAGTSFLHYAGKLSCDHVNSVTLHDYYQFSWEYRDKPRELNNMFKSKYEHAYITANSFGNHAHFIQHSPLTERLQQQYTFYNADGIPDETIKNNIATANIRLKPTLFYDCPIIEVIAIRDIPAGAQILFDYGDNYVAQMQLFEGIQFCFFNLNGNVDHHRFSRNEQLKSELVEEFEYNDKLRF
jgi:hypothetical protein